MNKIAKPKSFSFEFSRKLLSFPLLFPNFQPTYTLLLLLLLPPIPHPLSLSLSVSARAMAVISRSVNDNKENIPPAKTVIVAVLVSGKPLSSATGKDKLQSRITRKRTRRPLEDISNLFASPMHSFPVRYIASSSVAPPPSLSSSSKSTKRRAVNSLALFPEKTRFVYSCRNFR